MVFLDYLVIAFYLVGVLLIGFYFSKRAGKNTEAFINAGRSLPWWLAGTSMIVGAFGADSPLHQSRKIRQTGLAGAWFYWCQIGYHMVNSLVFSKLWRRSELTTPIEFYDLRYAGSGKKAARMWSVFYNAFVEQSIFTALGLLGLLKIVEILFELPTSVSVLGLEVAPAVLMVIGTVVIAMAYSAASGVWGVVVTDFAEFIVAMGCSYLLMFFIYDDVGWASGLQTGLADVVGELGPVLEFWPSWGLALFVYLFIQPFVFGYGMTAVNQRYLATKDPREALFSGIWRSVTHFVLRGWPWYVAGLVSLLLLDGLALDSEMAYPMLIREYMPAGLKGLMVAGFLAAFMSSIDTSVHTSTSIFVTDLYRPYLKPEASEAHYVLVSRLSIIAFTTLSVAIALLADGILELLLLVMKMQAGFGLVMLLRWFWWRVNGWADLAAQVVALPLALFFEHDDAICAALFETLGPTAWVMDLFGLSGLDDHYAIQFMMICTMCTIVWITVMFLTKPEPPAQLNQFYRRIRPYGFWTPVAEQCPDVVPVDSLRDDVRHVVLGLGLCYGMLFALGGLLLAWWGFALGGLIAAALCGFFLIRSINRSHG